MRFLKTEREFEVEWANKDQSVKLEQLYREQAKLKPKDGNVIGHDRCRFEALIQSYDLYSSEDFSKIKPLKNLLEENNAYRLGDEKALAGYNTDKGNADTGVTTAPALINAKPSNSKGRR